MLTLRQHCANTPSGLLLAQCANTTLRPTVGTPLWSQVRQHRANVKIRTLRDGWMARGRSGWLGVWRNGRDGSGKVSYVQCSYVTVRKLMSRTLPDLTARDDWTPWLPTYTSKYGVTPDTFTRHVSLRNPLSLMCLSATKSFKTESILQQQHAEQARNRSSGLSGAAPGVKLGQRS